MGVPSVPSCAPVSSSYVLTLLKVQIGSRSSLKLDVLHKDLSTSLCFSCRTADSTSWSCNKISIEDNLLLLSQGPWGIWD